MEEMAPERSVNWGLGKTPWVVVGDSVLSLFNDSLQKCFAVAINMELNQMRI